MNATLKDAVKLCRLMELITPSFGAHVALTGGSLYKDGERKDIDIILYRIRQVEQIDYDGLFTALSLVGIVKVSGFGWCYKLKWLDFDVDLLSPEELEGPQYPRTDDLLAQSPAK